MDARQKDRGPRLLSWLIFLAFAAGVILLIVRLRMGFEPGPRYAGQVGPDPHQLKEIALAFHNYEGIHGRFPPAALYSKDGRPLLSWRVLILPFLDGSRDADGLYEQFDLTEPWDGPHNLALLNRMPEVYGFHRREGPAPPPNYTYFQGIVGKGAAFEGKEGLRLADFTDELPNSFLIIQGGEPVPWTKPADISYDPALPLPKLATLPPVRSVRGFWAAYADSSTHFVKEAGTSERTIRALILRNGGEKKFGSFD